MEFDERFEYCHDKRTSLKSEIKVETTAVSSFGTAWALSILILVRVLFRVLICRHDKRQNNLDFSQYFFF